MYRNDINHLLTALAAIAVIVLVGLWSWNTLAALLGLPAAELRHILAALGMLWVLRRVLLPGNGYWRRRLLRPRRRSSST
jgi:uncharacterized membrane protein YuzA (DUF378 family)